MPPPRLSLWLDPDRWGRGLVSADREYLRLRRRRGGSVADRLGHHCTVGGDACQGRRCHRGAAGFESIVGSRFTGAVAKTVRCGPMMLLSRGSPAGLFTPAVPSSRWRRGTAWDKGSCWMTRSPARALTTGLLLASTTGAAHARDTTVRKSPRRWSRRSEMLEHARAGGRRAPACTAEDPVERGGCTWQAGGCRGGQGSNAGAFTQSTIRAVERCQPYGVLLDYPHDRWWVDEIVVNFDPPPPCASPAATFGVRKAT